MRQFLSLLFLLVALYLGKQLYSFWETVKARNTDPAQAAKPAETASSNLPGLPPSMEASLQMAQRNGAKSLRDWLKFYRRYVADPRLAAIELDYVILIGPSDRLEARRVLAEVGQRTPPTSPVYDRLKRLEKTYE